MDIYYILDIVFYINYISGNNQVSNSDKINTGHEKDI